MLDTVNVKTGDVFDAATAFKGMVAELAYVIPWGVIIRFVDLPTVHKVASFMYKLMYAITLVG